MVMSEIRHFLRKHDFPQSAKEALLHLEQFCCMGTMAQHQRLIQDILDEFIFYEPERRSLRRKKLNALQELQLLEVLIGYFVNQNNDIVRNTMFLMLFDCRSKYNIKMNVLQKLISLSIATKNSTVLSCSAVWIQHHGCNSDIVTSLVYRIVMDYFHLIPKSSNLLENLPITSPEFAALFITATTVLFKNSADAKELQLPDSLLTIITQWLNDYSQLCMAPILRKHQYSLPRGNMSPSTPLPGLIRWCVQAPLLNENHDESGNSGIIKGEALSARSFLYSQLHTGVLDSMMELQNMYDQVLHKEIISVRDVVCLIDDLLKTFNQKPQSSEENVCLTLDRFGQAIQVALATNCLYGNFGELYHHLKRLPNHRLLKLITTKNC